MGIPGYADLALDFAPFIDTSQTAEILILLK
jgi:hypothetical protein